VRRRDVCYGRRRVIRGHGEIVRGQARAYLGIASEGFIPEGAADRNTEPQVRFTKRRRVPIDIEVISPAAVAARRVPVV
jgi:hypothetical protein